MIVADAWNLRLGSSPFFYDRSLPNLVHFERDPLDAACLPGWNVEQHVAALGERVSGMVKVRAPACACCGATRYWRLDAEGNAHSHDYGLNRLWQRKTEFFRCGKHLDRNPCAIEGCARTGDARGYLADDVILCGTHWKLACPPGSAARRVYNRLFQLHRKRDGKGQPWSPDLDARYWRVWGTIVRRARGVTAGDLDMTEVNKLFGWDA